MTLLETSRLQLLASAVALEGISRELLLAHIDPSLVEQLPGSMDPAAQIDVDLRALDEAGMLLDGTVPLLGWLMNAESAAIVPALRRACIEAVAALVSALGSPHLPEEKLNELRDAAVRAGLDRQRLIASIPPGLLSPRSVSPGADAIADDLRVLNRAGLSGERFPLAVWLHEAITLAGVRHEALVFQEAMWALAAQVGRPAAMTAPTPPTPTAEQVTTVRERLPLVDLENLDLVQLERLWEALLSAYPNEGSLAMMVKLTMNERLDNIVNAEQPLRPIVLELLEWAHAQNRTRELLTGAVAHNPRSDALLQLARNAGLPLPKAPIKPPVRA
ncbi:MAG: effector-associated domain EAD1-containing protein [Minicystis sp.]